MVQTIKSANNVTFKDLEYAMLLGVLITKEQTREK